MKNRFEIELCDTEHNERGWASQAFTITDNEARELVTDAKGNSKFYDFEHYSDVPSYVSKFVTVYKIEQNYGGPEEGGWYYASWEPLCSMKVIYSEVSDIVQLLSNNYDIKEDSDSELRVIVELNKHEMVKLRPHYE